MNSSDFLERLTKVRPAGDHRWRGCCPAHDDSNPSLSVSVGDDGRILLKCHKGCSVEAIVAAIGITLRDLMPEPRTPSAPRPPKSAPKGHETPEAAVAAARRSLGGGEQDWREPTASIYRSRDDRELMRVIRFDRVDGTDKTFRPMHERGGRWYLSDPAGALPLYRLDQLGGDGLVVVVEGEKCADAAAALGFVATTSSHGAKSAAKTDWSPLAGRDVVCLPDNDVPGRTYMANVAKAVTALDPPARTRTVHLPELEVGGDIVDFIARRRAGGRTDEEVKGEIENLTEQSAGQESQAEPPKRSQRAPRNEIPKFEEFPTDALPPVARRLAEQGAASIGCSPSFIALPLLSVAASLIGNTRRLQLKSGWSEPAIVWTSIVGESGTQKSPAVELVLRPLRRQEEAAQREYEEDLKCWRVEYLKYEKKLRQWKSLRKKKGEEAGAFDDDPPLPPLQPVLTRFSCSDTTIEALAPLLQSRWRGLLMVRDELSGWLLGFNQYRKGMGGDTAAWLEVFGGRGVRIDRKTGVPRSIYIPRAAVSICGGIQPGALAGALGRDRFNDGMVARILFAYPPRKVARWSETVIDDDVVSEFATMLHDLARLEPRATDEGPQPQLLQLSGEAKAIWIRFHDENAGEQEGLDGDLAAAWSKLTGYAARFALVIHEMRAAAGESIADPFCVDAWSMEGGIRLSRWFEREAERVYAMLREDESERTLRQRCEVITRDYGGAVTTREWHQRNSRRPTSEAEAELQDLVDGGWAEWRKRVADSKGGRPTTECAILRRPTPAGDEGDSGCTPGHDPAGSDGGVSGCGYRGAGGQAQTNGSGDPKKADSPSSGSAETPPLHPETPPVSRATSETDRDSGPCTPQPETPSGRVRAVGQAQEPDSAPEAPTGRRGSGFDYDPLDAATGAPPAAYDDLFQGASPEEGR